MSITKNKSDIARSEQVILNRSIDDDFDVLAIEMLEYVPGNGANNKSLARLVSSNLAMRLDDTTTSNVTYLGWARPGTATNEAKWRIKKMDDSSGLVVTWADGNTDFDNVWDNRASISYS